MSERCKLWIAMTLWLVLVVRPWSIRTWGPEKVGNWRPGKYALHCGGADYHTLLGVVSINHVAPMDGSLHFCVYRDGKLVFNFRARRPSGTPTAWSLR